MGSLRPECYPAKHGGGLGGGIGRTFLECGTPRSGSIVDNRPGPFDLAAPIEPTDSRTQGPDPYIFGDIVRVAYAYQKADKCFDQFRVRHLWTSHARFYRSLAARSRSHSGPHGA
jgi:hypothetical protein